MIKDFLNSFEPAQLVLVGFVVIMLGFISFELVKFIISLFKKNW